MRADEARSVGCRWIEVFDREQRARVPMWLLYPTTATTRPESFGPYTVEVALDAEPAEPVRPLVVISHGNGGTPWAHRDLIARLVREGHAVAALEHPGNSRSDNSLSDAAGMSKAVNLGNRPRHIRLVIDAAFADARLGPQLASSGVGVVGHSIGGYTALASAGGHATTLPDDVPAAQRLDPDEVTLSSAFAVATERDRRVQAAVLLAPALGWLMAEGALAEVTIPLLVRTGQHDALCSTARVKSALRSLPPGTPIDLVEVPGAGHFSFQSPFPPAMVRPEFPPSQDPPGFDRAAYQRVLADEVVAFLGSALAAG